MINNSQAAQHKKRDAVLELYGDGLRMPAFLAAREGRPARVHSLRGRRDLNGRTAILIRWKESEGRWLVRLDSDELSLLPANLQRLPDTPWTVHSLMLSPELTAMVVGNLSPIGIVRAACTCRALAEAAMVRPFRLAVPRTNVQLTPPEAEWAEDVVVSSIALMSGGRVCLSEVQTLQVQPTPGEEESAPTMRNRLVVHTLDGADPQVMWVKLLPDVSVGLAAADDAVYYLEGRHADQLVRLSGTDGTETARTRLGRTDSSHASTVSYQQPILVHLGRIFILHKRGHGLESIGNYPLEIIVRRSADLGVVCPTKIALGVDMHSGFVANGAELFLWENYSHSKSVVRETICVFSLEGDPLRVLQLPQSSPTRERKLVGSTGSFLLLHGVINDRKAPDNQLSVFEVWSVHGSLLMASPEEVWPSIPEKHLFSGIRRGQNIASVPAGQWMMFNGAASISCDDDRLVVVRNSASFDAVNMGPLTGFVC